MLFKKIHNNKEYKYVNSKNGYTYMRSGKEAIIIQPDEKIIEYKDSQARVEWLKICEVKSKWQQ